MSKHTQNEYMLLFRDNGWYKSLPSEELQKVMAQNKAWIERLMEQGIAKGGRALAREGAAIGKGGKVLTDGPFAESKEAIGGYMVVEVESMEKAIEIARNNPGLAYGTTIEVRPLSDECPLDACVRQLKELELASAKN